MVFRLCQQKPMANKLFHAKLARPMPKVARFFVPSKDATKPCIANFMPFQSVKKASLNMPWTIIPCNRTPLFLTLTIHLVCACLCHPLALLCSFTTCKGHMVSVGFLSLLAGFKNWSTTSSKRTRRFLWSVLPPVTS